MKRFSSIIAYFYLAAVFSLSASAQDNLALGKSALKEKKYIIAIEYLLKVQKANPKDKEANFLLGDAYRQKEVFDSSKIFLERSLDFDDEYIPTLVAIIPVYAKLGAWDKAAKRYNEAMKYDKKNTDASIMYANTFLAADSLDKAVLYFLKAKEVNENIIDVYLGLAEAYGRQNIGVLAVENLKKAIELDPKSPSIRYKLGSAYYKNRQFNDAARELQETINLDPKNEKAVYEVANLFYRAKMYRDAAKFFEKYVALKNTNADAYEQYAISLYNSKMYKDAVPVLEQAQRMKPTVFNLKPMLAQSYFFTGEFQKSIDQYKSIPKDSLGVDDFIHIGRSYAKIKDADNAITNFELAAKIDTASVEVTAELGNLYMGKKMFDKAAVQYGRKVIADPNNISALVNGGLCYRAIGKLDTAKTFFKRAVELKPDFLPVQMHLAFTFYMQDSSDLSKAQYQRVLSIIDTIKIDSVKTGGKTKEEVYSQQLLEGNKWIGLIELIGKRYSSAVEYLRTAMKFESKEKPDEDMHLWLAQSYALLLGNKDLSDDERKVYRQKAIDEYRLVLKINKSNKAANKEIKQLEGAPSAQ